MSPFHKRGGSPSRGLGGARREDPLFSFPNKHPFILLDGALATELEDRGADLNDPLWSAKMLVEATEMIRKVHFDYFMAGADVATSASYQATFEGFEKKGLSEKETKALLRLSVRLAKEARTDFWKNPAHRKGRRFPMVAASVGPYGAFLADGSEYRGQYGLDVGALMAFHGKRMEVLIESEPDILAFETIPSYEEAIALAKLLEEFPNAKAWLSFSCRDEAHISDGTPLEKAVSIADSSDQIIAVGVNCVPPNLVSGLLKKARTVTQKPLVVYPNNGEIWDAKKHCWVAGSGKDDFGKLVLEWHEAGARLIGGCCRTKPEDIREMRKELRGI